MLKERTSIQKRLIVWYFCDDGFQFQQYKWSRVFLFNLKSLIFVVSYFVLTNFLLVCALCLWLQEKRRNNLKDFLNVAGPLGVTHFLILSKTETAPYLKVARTPQGPTLTFKIHEYSLAVDVAQSQLRPRCPQDLFKNSPLVTFHKHTYTRASLSIHCIYLMYFGAFWWWFLFIIFSCFTHKKMHKGIHKHKNKCIDTFSSLSKSIFILIYPPLESVNE